MGRNKRVQNAVHQMRRNFSMSEKGFDIAPLPPSGREVDAESSEASGRSLTQTACAATAAETAAVLIFQQAV